ncbi:MAG: hypothetical protein LH481_02350, partial [Burkholderiales bacterium]|nr:hypothetical protein [Burkholderiales bacterium]
MKTLPRYFVTYILLTLSVSLAPAIAQVVAPEANPPPVQGATNLPTQPPAAVPGTPPIVDPAYELNGAALVEALRKGGFVLYMRHTEAGLPAEKCDENSLSAVGTADARIVGAALRELKIPIGVVRSSAPCRTFMAGVTLGLGAVEITEDLNPV